MDIKNTDKNHEPLLFTEEELLKGQPGTLWYHDPNKDKLVTVLGHTFKNDDERREYFREELRKKLPELKKMEGFPIGEDDDIINLSDPPYYTACPNPWLNDFIDEWEQEKKQLAAEGKREENAVVTEPYASDVSEGKNNPIYMAHAYHTKVPHPAIMRYILHYTQPGDIIFDGFAGTGMTGVAANLCGSKAEVEKLNEKNAKVGVRHGICSDLSPIATLIAASYNLPFDDTIFEEKAKAILDQVEKELGWMYETEVEVKVGTETKKLKAKVNYTIWSDVFTCPNCGKEIVLWKESVDLDGNKINSSFPCPNCGFECSKKNMEHCYETIYDSILGKTISVIKKIPVRINYTLRGHRGEKNIEKEDIELLKKIEELPIEANACRMPEGSEARRNDKYGITHIHQFFTKRNFITLQKVSSLIGNDVVFKTWITSTLQRTTKQYKFTLDRKFGILSGTLYIPSLSVELNPCGILKRKINDFKKMHYENMGNGIIQLSSATNIASIRDNSIDYMFVDPPFGSNIMYSELSSIWEGWIGIKTNSMPEAVVNSKRTLFAYQDLMTKSFREFFRILKPGKWVTIEFSNTSASVWNSIKDSLRSVGFVIANVSALDKKQGTFKAINTTTAVKEDLVISCYKPSANFIEKIEQSQNKNENVWDFINEHMLHLAVHVEHANTTTAIIERSAKILYDSLISYYLKHGYNIPMDALQFQTGLRERFVERDGMFFTAHQAAEYEEKKKHTSGVAPMGLIISDEANGIEWLKHELKEPKTYAEISPKWMADISGLKKGDILPELKDILEENFIEDENGRWHIPDLEKAIDLEKLHHKNLMREFNLYKEQAAKPRARIKEVRVEALREGFKECFKEKDYKTILTIADKIPQNVLTEDDQLLQYYDIASMRA